VTVGKTSLELPEPALFIQCTMATDISGFPAAQFQTIHLFDAKQALAEFKVGAKRWMR